MSALVPMNVMLKTAAISCIRGEVPGIRAFVAPQNPAIPASPTTRNTIAVTTIPTGFDIF